MFEFNLGILRILHDEHAAMLAVLERLEKLLTAHGPDNAPDVRDAGIAKLLGDVTAALGDDISHHYAFEETHLFPRFAEYADPGISNMLKDEHDLIRPLATGLLALIERARSNGFDQKGWAEFHEIASDVTEREIFHVQKEEMGFLPLLDQVLDDDLDGELQMAYMEMKA